MYRIVTILAIAMMIAFAGPSACATDVSQDSERDFACQQAAAKMADDPFDTPISPYTGCVLGRDGEWFWPIAADDDRLQTPVKADLSSADAVAIQQGLTDLYEHLDSIEIDSYPAFGDTLLSALQTQRGNCSYGAGDSVMLSLFSEQYATALGRVMNSNTVFSGYISWWQGERRSGASPFVLQRAPWDGTLPKPPLDTYADLMVFKRLPWPYEIDREYMIALFLAG